MASEIQRKNKIFRLAAMVGLAIILITLVSLLQSSHHTSYLQYSLFTISSFICFYILYLIFYAKAQRERNTKLDEEKHRSIIAVSALGAWEYHTGTRYLWCSHEYFHMLGYDKQSFLKQNTLTIEDAWINRLHPDDRESAVEKFKIYVAEERSDLFENTFRLKHQSGEWLWVLSRSKALLKTDGTPGKVMLGTHIDITEKIKTQMALHRRNQKLTDFAYSNAHHVRGPVARILGLAELRKIDNEKDNQWYIDTITNEVKDLDQIIKSIALELDEINELP